MAGLRGVLVGVLSLVALQTIVSTRGAANRTAGLMHDIATIIDHVVSPAVPFFADHSKPEPAPATTTTADLSTTPAPSTVPPARAPAPLPPLPPGETQTGPTYNT